MTLKDTTTAVEGLRKRAEFTEPLPENGIEALGGIGPVASRLHTLAGDRSLHTVLEVHTTRQPYDLRIDGENVAEVALDETSITTDDEQRPTALVPRRGRGRGRVGRSPHTSGGAIEELLWSAAHDALEVRGRPPGNGPRDPRAP